MFAPGWVFQIAVMRTAAEFLSSELGLEAFGEKYSGGIEKIYGQKIPVEAFTETAQSILEFLSEIEAGDQAVELLTDFTYFRLYNESIGRPRKMKSMFGSIEDPVKQSEFNTAETIKAFRAYVFGLRSNTVPQAPEGWRLETDEHIESLKPVLEQSVSLLDIL
jgi:hypothetical protein